LFWWALDRPDTQEFDAQVLSSDLKIPAIGFARVDGSHPWEFPRDLGPHPDYQREQWRIRSGEACQVSFEVVFDRATLVPDPLMVQRASDWAMQSLMTGTLIVQNRDGATLADAAVYSRIAIGLAGAEEKRVWIENWGFEWGDRPTLTASAEDAELDLTLTPADPATPGIEDGWYTFAMPAQVAGSIEVAGESFQVNCGATVTRRFGTF
jgi:predicted secreted hydrolase